MPTFGRILIPVDTAPPPDDAIAMGRSIARESGGSLLLLHVMRSDRVVGTPMESTWSGIPEAVREEGREILERVSTTLTDSSIPVETALREGTPSRNIISCATDEQCDLIIMATRGRLGVERLLLGSVTEQVVRQSPVPVLTVQSGSRKNTTTGQESFQNV